MNASNRAKARNQPQAKVSSWVQKALDIEHIQRLAKKQFRAEGLSAQKTAHTIRFLLWYHKLIP